MNEANVTVVVLWESELRAASAALAAINEHAKRVNAKEEEHDGQKVFALWHAAIEACYAAIGGIHKRPDGHIVVASHDRLDFAPQKAGKKKEAKRP